MINYCGTFQFELDGGPHSPDTQGGIYTSAEATGIRGVMILSILGCGKKKKHILIKVWHHRMGMIFKKQSSAFGLIVEKKVKSPISLSFSNFLQKSTYRVSIGFSIFVFPKTAELICTHPQCAERGDGFIAQTPPGLESFCSCMQNCSLFVVTRVWKKSTSAIIPNSPHLPVSKWKCTNHN